jgi:hypothetical protein
LAGQRDDGGWAPFWAPGYSSLDATCFRLAQAEQLGLARSHPAVARATGFLASRQQSDGSWEEEAAVASLAPPWARPGDPAARLYLSANCGFWLALLDGSSEAASRAAELLEGHLEPDGHLASFLQANWLAAGIWLRLGRHEPAGRTLGYLHRRLADMPAGNLAWLLTTLLAAGAPLDHPLLNAAAGRLAEQQEQAGHWASDDGPGFNVHVTLEALRALRELRPER